MLTFYRINCYVPLTHAILRAAMCIHIYIVNGLVFFASRKVVLKYAHAPILCVIALGYVM